MTARTNERANTHRDLPPKTKSTSSWIGSHQIEGDGLICLLYFHLWKKTKHFQSCPEARVPDTVVYEHNFPRGWYCYDPKNKEIVRQSGRSLDSQHIYMAFSKPLEPGLDIVAQYLYSTENEQGMMQTSVEFLTKDELFQFLNVRKERPDGILQRFLPPKTKHNHQIQAIWSPRVTLVQRRANKHPLTDRVISPYARCVTFDGPSHYSEDGLCAQQTKEQINTICNLFVEHFHNTDHKYISRMVLYFKIDKDDVIWLLWGNSIRIGPAKFHSQKRVPLNLSPQFIAPNGQGDTIGAFDDRQLVKELQEADEAHLGLSGDVLMAKSLGIRPSSPTSTKLPQITSPTRSKTPAEHIHASDHQVRLPELNRPATAPIIKETGNPHNTHMEVVDQWKSQLLKERDRVQGVMDDIIYSIYSHFFLKNNTQPFICSPPIDIFNDSISPLEMEDLMRAAMLVPMDDAINTFVCHKPNKPVVQLSENMRNHVELIFKEKFDNPSSVKPTKGPSFSSSMVSSAVNGFDGPRLSSP